MLGKCSSLEEVDSWWLLAVSIFFNNVSNYDQETSRSNMSFVICMEWHVPYFVWNMPTCQHVSRHSSPCGNLCSDTAWPISCGQRLGKTHYLHIHCRVFYPEKKSGTFFWSTVNLLPVYTMLQNRRACYESSLWKPTTLRILRLAYVGLCIEDIWI